MKKFDVNKFFKILATPKKYKRFLNKNGKPAFDVPDEFGLNTDKYQYRIRDLDTALEDAGYKELLKINKGTEEERRSISFNANIDEDIYNVYR